MKYQVNTLNISIAIFLLGIIVYTILNYKTLSSEEGWRIV